MKSKHNKNGIATMSEPVKSQLHGDRQANAKTAVRVRSESPSDTRSPNLTFAHETMTFNKSCVNLFPDSQHVTITIDTQKRRLFIEPTTSYDVDGLQFANVKNGRNVPRICTTRIFCFKLFDFMKRDTAAKYRIETIYQEFGDRKIMVFNLDEALPMFPEGKKIEGSKNKRSNIVYMSCG